MAYNQTLASRVDGVLAKEPGMTSKRMFGSICYLLNGNMCCGVVGDRLMVRVGKEQYDEVLKIKGAQPMDLTGRPLTGLILVDASAIGTEFALRRWVQMGLDFTKTLPRKIKKFKKLRHPPRENADN